MPKKSGHLRYTNDESDDWQPPKVTRPDDAPVASDEETFASDEASDEEDGESDQ